MKEDSVHGIYDTLKDCALISKYSGGIGLHIHNIRANHSFINGTNGYQTGLRPQLREYLMIPLDILIKEGEKKWFICDILRTMACWIFWFLEL